MIRIQRYFSSHLGAKLEKKALNQKLEILNILGFWKEGEEIKWSKVTGNNSFPNHLLVENSYFDSWTSSYLQEKRRYYSKIEEEILKTIPSQFSFLKHLFKHMNFVGRHQSRDLIFPLFWKKYSSSQESLVELIENTGVCLEYIETGSVLFDYMNDPLALVPILQIMPELKTKLRPENMMLAADYFYSISAQKSTELKGDEDVRLLSKINELEGKSLFCKFESRKLKEGVQIEPMDKLDLLNFHTLRNQISIRIGLNQIGVSVTEEMEESLFNISLLSELIKMKNMESSAFCDRNQAMREDLLEFSDFVGNNSIEFGSILDTGISHTYTNIVKSSDSLGECYASALSSHNFLIL